MTCCSRLGGSSVSASRDGTGKGPNAALIATPETTARVTMTVAKAMAARLPWRLLTRPSVEMLVAGPVMRKAIPAPGDSPVARNAATRGVAEAAQT